MGEYYLEKVAAVIQNNLKQSETIRQETKKNHFGMIKKITYSFGMAIKIETLESLYERSDQALYEAKKLSRNL